MLTILAQLHILPIKSTWVLLQQNPTAELALARMQQILVAGSSQQYPPRPVRFLSQDSSRTNRVSGSGRHGQPHKSASSERYHRARPIIGGVGTCTAGQARADSCVVSCGISSSMSQDVPLRGRVCVLLIWALALSSSCHGQSS